MNICIKELLSTTYLKEVVLLHHRVEFIMGSLEMVRNMVEANIGGLTIENMKETTKTT